MLVMDKTYMGGCFSHSSCCVLTYFDCLFDFIFFLTCDLGQLSEAVMPPFPQDYAGRVYEMMANMSATSENVTAPQPTEPAPSAEEKREEVTPEVVEGESSGGDPWKK